jgi:hypothetical protein
MQVFSVKLEEMQAHVGLLFRTLKSASSRRRGWRKKRGRECVSLFCVLTLSEPARLRKTGVIESSPLLDGRGSPRVMLTKGEMMMPNACLRHASVSYMKMLSPALVRLPARHHCLDIQNAECTPVSIPSTCSILTVFNTDFHTKSGAQGTCLRQ